MKTDNAIYWKFFLHAGKTTKAMVADVDLAIGLFLLTKKAQCFVFPLVFEICCFDFERIIRNFKDQILIQRKWVASLFHFRKSEPNTNIKKYLTINTNYSFLPRIAVVCQSKL